MAEDLLHQNYPSLTGTPANVLGPLTALTQGLRLSSTDTWVVADSASSSLAVADGGVGGAAMEGWFSLPTIPGTTQTILGKVGSYELKITAAGKLQWILTNGASTVTITSAATIAAGTWYHFAGVYNGDYTGTPVFGYQTQGATQLTMTGDYSSGVSTGATDDLQVCKATILEKGVTTSIVMDLQSVHDATLRQWIVPVMFEDLAGLPGRLLAKGTPLLLRPADYMTRTWVSFVIAAGLQPGDCWPGWIGGQNSGMFRIGAETSGSTRKWRAASISDVSTFTANGDAPDPFGTPVSGDSAKVSMYVNYTPTGRTGAEGKALIYLNGVEDASAAYTHGIADTANNLQHPAGVAVDLDDWTIFNKKLTPVQVAQHNASR